MPMRCTSNGPEAPPPPLLPKRGSSRRRARAAEQGTGNAFAATPFTRGGGSADVESAGGKHAVSVLGRKETSLPALHLPPRQIWGSSILQLVPAVPWRTRAQTPTCPLCVHALPAGCCAPQAMGGPMQTMNGAKAVTSATAAEVPRVGDCAAPLAASVVVSAARAADADPRIGLVVKHFEALHDGLVAMDEIR